MAGYLDKIRVEGKSVLFWIGALFTLIAPVIVGVTARDANTTWVVALCGAFVTLLTKIDDFVEISLGPLRARMRESISEANATLKQLRALAASVAHFSFTELVAGCFLGGITMKDRFALHDKLMEDLRALGVSASQISDAELGWRKGIAILYHNIVRGCLEGRKRPTMINSEASEEVKAASAEFQSLLHFESWRAPTPDEMEKFISTRGMMTDELREWINDYRHFNATGEIRRRETFLTYFKG